MAHNVFVYGTLRPGHHNHDRLLSNAVHLGQACTDPIDSYTMHLSHLDGGIPFVTRGATDYVSHIIFGNLFQVTDKELLCLDALEQHPFWYCREEVNVYVTTGSGKRIAQTAWMYILPDHHLDTNIKNQTGDFNNIATFSDNSHITLIPSE